MVGAKSLGRRIGNDLEVLGIQHFGVQVGPPPGLEV